MADLSSGATERIVINIFDARPVAAKNLMMHITDKNVMNCLEQSTGHAPAIACPPDPKENY